MVANLDREFGRGGRLKTTDGKLRYFCVELKTPHGFAYFVDFQRVKPPKPVVAEHDALL
jgi:hypothetical protein